MELKLPPSVDSGETLTGAEIVIRCLKAEGVEFIFGYPGGAVLHIYDAIFKQKDVKHILVRHEQGALHAADGYARATGKPGVALVTSATPGLPVARAYPSAACSAPCSWRTRMCFTAFCLKIAS